LGDLDSSSKAKLRKEKKYIVYQQQQNEVILKFVEKKSKEKAKKG